MANSTTFSFVQGSPRGKQKQKRNLRQYLRTLPAHKRLDKFEKLWRKRQFQNKDRNDR